MKCLAPPRPPKAMQLTISPGFPARGRYQGIRPYGRESLSDLSLARDECRASAVRTSPLTQPRPCFNGGAARMSIAHPNITSWAGALQPVRLCGGPCSHILRIGHSRSSMAAGDDSWSQTWTLGMGGAINLVRRTSFVGPFPTAGKNSGEPSSLRHHVHRLLAASPCRQDHRRIPALCSCHGPELRRGSFCRLRVELICRSLSPMRCFPNALTLGTSVLSPRLKGCCPKSRVPSARGSESSRCRRPRRRPPSRLAPRASHPPARPSSPRAARGRPWPRRT